MFGRIVNFLFGDLLRGQKFYYLSLIKEDDGSFSIHGLWPQFNKTSYPSYCKKVDFSIDKLESIIEELNKFWYSTMEKNDDFWKHEYVKHGSCMFTNMNELQYFSKTLELYKEAVRLGLPEKYEENEKNRDYIRCLIPVSLDFKFMDD